MTSRRPSKICGQQLTGQNASSSRRLADPVSYSLVTYIGDGDGLRIAQNLMHAGQAEGAIPKDRAELTGDESAVFAIDAAGGMVGGAVFFQPDGHPNLWLDILYVAPAWRRRGIGRYLVAEVLDQARIMDLRGVEFGTLTTNAAMQALGAMCGFEQSAVYMSRVLTSRPFTENSSE